MESKQSSEYAASSRCLKQAYAIVDKRAATRSGPSCRYEP